MELQYFATSAAIIWVQIGVMFKLDPYYCSRSKQTKRNPEQIKWENCVFMLVQCREFLSLMITSSLIILWCYASYK
jgi:hypothetical protein